MPHAKVRRAQVGFPRRTPPRRSREVLKLQTPFFEKKAPEMLNRKLPPWLALAALFFCFAATARAQTESLPELIRRVKPSVVSVITYNAKGEVALTGSGFFVRPGQVLTNLHVVEGAHRAEVRT